MTTTATPHAMPRNDNMFARAEAWLDARGRFGWIFAMVLGFIVFWPVGLALLAYMIWGKGFFSRSRRDVTACFAAPLSKSSGNAAFDAYRDETMRRLEEEQENFESFLARLREAKDKAEFDAFMDERAAKAKAQTAE
jgi:hypothetical protein